MSMPREPKRYVHRVGRTARAGQKGRAVTLVGKSGQQWVIMKKVLHLAREAGQQVGTRKVPRVVVDHWKKRIMDLAPDILHIHKEERMEKEIRIAEMEANK